MELLVKFRALRFGLPAARVPLHRTLERTQLKPLHVVWWNIEGGETNERLGGNPLGNFLKGLVAREDVPDILVLGEYRPGAIDAETRERLNESYREIFISYNAELPDEGILVLTRADFTASAESELLDWTPNRPMAPSEREAFRRRWRDGYPDSTYFTKPYIRIRVEGEGVRFSLLPVHLIQPWERIKLDFGRMGFFASALSVLFGRANPFFYQAKRLRECLTRDFGPSLDSEPFLVIGDFNVPFRSRGFRFLKKGLVSAFRRPSVTFPTPEASRAPLYPPMQIDHGLHSPGWETEEAQVLRVQGSDHFPIVIKLRACHPSHFCG